MSGGTAASRRTRRVLPILDWLPRYDRRRLRPDLLAGCVIAALAVPQALGYAAIAGVPVEVGLYAVPVALIMYAIFGTSRQLVIGPVSTVSVLSGSLVAAMQPAAVVQAVLFTTAAAMWVGVILVVAALLRIGAEAVTNAVRHGYATRIQFHFFQNDRWRMTVTDNGIPPAKPIREGGGIGGMRRRITQLGGVMELYTIPRFRIELSVPKEVERA